MSSLRAPKPVIAFFALAALWLLAHELQVTVAPWLPAGPSRVSHVPWLLGCALVCGWGALRRDRGRAAWLCFAAGILSWTLGEIALIRLLAGGDEIPIPSVADAGYLGAVLLWFAGLTLLVIQQQHNGARAVLIDGLTCALTLAAAGAAVIFPKLAVVLAGDPVVVAVNLAYPLLDLILLGATVLIVALRGWRPDTTLLLLAAGIVLFWVSDTRYLIQVAEDQYVQGGWSDAGWWSAMGLVACTAWTRPVRRVAQARTSARMLIAIPGAFAIAAVALLVYAGFETVTGLAVGLAGAALVSGTVRMMLTLRDNLAALRATHVEAHTDPLTGLGNRRQLLLDLQERIDQEVSFVLAVFDLNGFKRFNDAFGHPAGDALLVRLARSLRRVCDDVGGAYRLGGDEFCALIADDAGTRATVLALGVALAESGPGYEVTAAVGTVTVPADARTPAQALATADARMYEAKRASRSAAVGTLTLQPLAAAGSASSVREIQSGADSARAATGGSTGRGRGLANSS